MEELTQSRGVIAIEIDVWKDTDGGRFRYAAAPKLARGDGDTGAEKDTPGMCSRALLTQTSYR